MEKSKSLKTETYPSVKDLEDLKAETKENFLRMNKMFKDMFRDTTVDTRRELTRLQKSIEKLIEELHKIHSGQIEALEKRIIKLEKSLEDIESTADGAESLAGEVELDLADLTVRVDSLEAKK